MGPVGVKKIYPNEDPQGGRAMQRRKLMVGLMMSCCWALRSMAAPVDAPPAPGPQDLSKFPRAQVVRVIDGDKVLLRINGGERLCRLVGVDATEPAPPVKGAEPYGPEASRFTANLLAGEEVWVAANPLAAQFDDYQRLLAYLFRVPDGLFVNLELVRQGYARAYCVYPFAYSSQFQRSEAVAKAAGKGMWAKTAASTQDRATTVTTATTARGSAPRPNTLATHRGMDKTVYITAKGKKYHAAGCRIIKRGATPITLGEALRRGLTPCAICRP